MYSAEEGTEDVAGIVPRQQRYVLTVSHKLPIGAHDCSASDFGTTGSWADDMPDLPTARTFLVATSVANEQLTFCLFTRSNSCPKG